MGKEVKEKSNQGMEKDNQKVEKEVKEKSNQNIEKEVKEKSNKSTEKEAKEKSKHHHEHSRNRETKDKHRSRHSSRSHDKRTNYGDCEVTIYVDKSILLKENYCEDAVTKNVRENITSVDLYLSGILDSCDLVTDEAKEVVVTKKTSDKTKSVDTKADSETSLKYSTVREKHASPNRNKHQKDPDTSERNIFDLLFSEREDVNSVNNEVGNSNGISGVSKTTEGTHAKTGEVGNPDCVLKCTKCNSSLISAEREFKSACELDTTPSHSQGTNKIPISHSLPDKDLPLPKTQNDTDNILTSTKITIKTEQISPLSKSNKKMNKPSPVCVQPNSQGIESVHATLSKSCDITPNLLPGTEECAKSKDIGNQTKVLEPNCETVISTLKPQPDKELYPGVVNAKDLSINITETSVLNHQNVIINNIKKEIITEDDSQASKTAESAFMDNVKSSIDARATESLITKEGNASTSTEISENQENIPEIEIKKEQIEEIVLKSELMDISFENRNELQNHTVLETINDQNENINEAAENDVTSDYEGSSTGLLSDEDDVKEEAIDPDEFKSSLNYQNNKLSTPIHEKQNSQIISDCSAVSTEQPQKSSPSDVPIAKSYVFVSSRGCPLKVENATHIVETANASLMDLYDIAKNYLKDIEGKTVVYFVCGLRDICEWSNQDVVSNGQRSKSASIDINGHEDGIVKSFTDKMEEVVKGLKSDSCKVVFATLTTMNFEKYNFGHLIPARIWESNDVKEKYSSMQNKLNSVLKEINAQIVCMNIRNEAKTPFLHSYVQKAVAKKNKLIFYYHKLVDGYLVSPRLTQRWNYILQKVIPFNEQDYKHESEKITPEKSKAGFNEKTTKIPTLMDEMLTANNKTIKDTKKIQETKTEPRKSEQELDKSTDNISEIHQKLISVSNTKSDENKDICSLSNNSTSVLNNNSTSPLHEKREEINSQMKDVLENIKRVTERIERIRSEQNQNTNLITSHNSPSEPFINENLPIKICENSIAKNLFPMNVNSTTTWHIKGNLFDKSESCLKLSKLSDSDQKISSEIETQNGIVLAETTDILANDDKTNRNDKGRRSRSRNRFDHTGRGRSKERGNDGIRRSRESRDRYKRRSVSRDRRRYNSRSRSRELRDRYTRRRSVSRERRRYERSRSRELRNRYERRRSSSNEQRRDSERSSSRERSDRHRGIDSRYGCNNSPYSNRYISEQSRSPTERWEYNRKWNHEHEDTGAPIGYYDYDSVDTRMSSDVSDIDEPWYKRRRGEYMPKNRHSFRTESSPESKSNDDRNVNISNRLPKPFFVFNERSRRHRENTKNHDYRRRDEKHVIVIPDSPEPKSKLGVKSRLGVPTTKVSMTKLKSSSDKNEKSMKSVVTTKPQGKDCSSKLGKRQISDRRKTDSNTSKKPTRNVIKTNATVTIKKSVPKKENKPQTVIPEKKAITPVNIKKVDTQIREATSFASAIDKLIQEEKRLSLKNSPTEDTLCNNGQCDNVLKTTDLIKENSETPIQTVDSLKTDKTETETTSSNIESPVLSKKQRRAIRRKINKVKKKAAKKLVKKICWKKIKPLIKTTHEIDDLVELSSEEQCDRSNNITKNKNSFLITFDTGKLKVHATESLISTQDISNETKQMKEDLPSENNKDICNKINEGAQPPKSKTPNKSLVNNVLERKQENSVIVDKHENDIPDNESNSAIVENEKAIEMKDSQNNGTKQASSTSKAGSLLPCKSKLNEMKLDDAKKEPKPKNDRKETKPDDKNVLKPDINKIAPKPDNNQTDQKPDNNQTERKPDNTQTERKPDKKQTERKPDNDKKEIRPNDKIGLNQDNTSDTKEKDNSTGFKRKLGVLDTSTDASNASKYPRIESDKTAMTASKHKNATKRNVINLTGKNAIGKGKQPVKPNAQKKSEKPKTSEKTTILDAYKFFERAYNKFRFDRNSEVNFTYCDSPLDSTADDNAGFHADDGSFCMYTAPRTAYEMCFHGIKIHAFNAMCEFYTLYRDVCRVSLSEFRYKLRNQLKRNCDRFFYHSDDPIYSYMGPQPRFATADVMIRTIAETIKMPRIFSRVHYDNGKLYHRIFLDFIDIVGFVGFNIPAYWCQVDFCDGQFIRALPVEEPYGAIEYS